MELIETERHYVRDLISLIERYLEPLRDEMFLSGDELDQLFGNIRGIVQFQKLFLQSLEEAIETIPDFRASNFKDEDLRRVLSLVGGSFMYYAHHFKLYSSFCASHSKAQKMIACEENAALQEFLKARNPRQQHSSTIESFLIKPIQRILKYPLLLKQLVELSAPQSYEHAHLKDALRAMEAVAEHINEMQKIYEEYGVVLEELSKQHKQQQLLYNQPPTSSSAAAAPSTSVDLNVGELQMYGTVNWVNWDEELTSVKLRKDCDLLTLVFIFKTAVVILARERQKNKKKGKNVNSKSNIVGSFQMETCRFKLVIPVDQLQVRTLVGDATDKHGLWELVFCRSEKEGRPKKVFQFVSSHRARNDFIRTIHHAMHENIRRSTLNSDLESLKFRSLPNQQQQQQQQQQLIIQQRQQQQHQQMYVVSLGAGRLLGNNNQATPAKPSTSATSSLSNLNNQPTAIIRPICPHSNHQRFTQPLPQQKSSSSSSSSHPQSRDQSTSGRGLSVGAASHFNCRDDSCIYGTGSSNFTKNNNAGNTKNTNNINPNANFSNKNTNLYSANFINNSSLSSSSIHSGSNCFTPITSDYVSNKHICSSASSNGHNTKSSSSSYFNSSHSNVVKKL
ncbi:hypothetical protein HELRODRAFT_99976 [Helobdella robusta]|uniref:DH domain-containing protein n=1 Tax=Helobdella robusta TaxID=6412 RepID=T1G9V9_HELRO|nr:hypothetical protein HELRODRAFT_99976 [Helobdella robusta]ESO03700.1 hypothetical protein HELRODRAFT_99976 [Helobdella robusta]